MHAAADIVGAHPSIVEMRRLIAKVAASPARSVLIYGETGTGKGMVARMLHAQSPRARAGFVDVNCGAIPASLLESELFGHERGAFTGAVARKAGLIEAADGGTLFLDEIREMEPVLQTKMLTFLDTQSFRRVGATKSIEVDVRFVGASNRILFGEVKAGRFREDLYYRLQVIGINIPPLRERGDDVLLLTEHFIRRYNARYGRAIHGWEPAVEEILLAHRWPGNVRELENTLERIFVLESDDLIRARHVPPRITRELGAAPAGGLSPGPLPGMSYHRATRAFQRRLIEDALARADGSMGRAAALLGLSRHALRHQMGKLEMA